MHLETVFSIKMCLITLIGIGSLFSAQAAPPPSAFGIWGDEDLDPKEYPFEKGVACRLIWTDVEKQPGLFDWSTLDNAIATAVKRNQFFFLSINVGPESPAWIYTQGVPIVELREKTFPDKLESYPFYPSPEYKSLFHRLITEMGKHIHSYPIEKQERIVFIQVKTGCTGDECAYKGKAVEEKYDLHVKSPAWREFRLWVFDLYTRTFHENPDYPQIALLFNNADPADTEGGGRSPDTTKSGSGWRRTLMAESESSLSAARAVTT